jgi:hypothetical protein
MILKFKGVRHKYAIGLRWAVDTREGIEQITQATGLSYGCVSDLRSTSNKKLKSFALAKEDHQNAISLAGMFSKMNENLIFVHRLNDYHYWLCIVFEGEVWSGVDLPKATAGDFVGDIEKINKTIEAAKEVFAGAEIDSDTISYCSDSAGDEFPSYQAVSFIEKIIQAQKYRRAFKIRYLETASAVAKKAIVVALIIATIAGGSYYMYKQKVVSELINRRAIEARQAAERAEKLKQQYFVKLEKELKSQWAYTVIGDLMRNFQYVGMGSKGWELTEATFDAARPDRLSLSLRRSEYGTVDSFFYAYTPEGKEGRLDKNNNKGEKRISFPETSRVDGYATPPPVDMLTSKETVNRSRLISYMQVRGADFGFKIDAPSVSKYKVTSSAFTVSADALWKLVKLQSVLRDYQTVVANTITFDVRGYEMSWELSGEVYA